MDDVTSGFNIGTNVSLMPEFNEVLGFTAAEVRAILESYRDHGVFDQDVDEALAVMSEWYNGYRFAKRAEQSVYNTGMVLYYVKASVSRTRGAAGSDRHQRRTAGAAVSGRAVHRPGGRVPRLGTGPRRRRGRRRLSPSIAALRSAYAAPASRQSCITLPRPRRFAPADPRRHERRHPCGSGPSACGLRWHRGSGAASERPCPGWRRSARRVPIPAPRERRDRTRRP